jgi:tRNA A-37 threonylcarbamoyl transferase component Bud32
LNEPDVYKVERSWRRFSICRRDEAEMLAPILEAPDEWLHKGQLLKEDPGTALALLSYAGQPYVLKHYSIKGAWHGLSRGIRLSRAWRCWQEGHRLLGCGLATPRPLAVIEKRLGPWRGAAWLLCEYCTGPRLSDYWAVDERPPEAELAAISRLFQGLKANRIRHGDLKKHNILWHQGQPVLIDLDAARHYRWHWSFRLATAHAKDRARFLRNWPEDSVLHQALKQRLGD